MDSPRRHARCGGQIGPCACPRTWRSPFRLVASPRPRVPASPRPRVPASPRPRVPASPRPRVPASPRPRVPAWSLLSQVPPLRAVALLGLRPALRVAEDLLAVVAAVLDEDLAGVAP